MIRFLLGYFLMGLTFIILRFFYHIQSQILERSAMEIWGYIILNGTDVLTITVVLGYLVQKFIENK